ncbi:FHA domain-containing protein [Nocardia sp. NPDC055321]
MKGRVEVVPGGHLVACVDGVIIVVAHRTGEPVTAAAEAVSVLDTLAEFVQEAASRETRRTGRTFARLVSKWLMGRADEEQVEFGVLTPGSRGLSVFLHGGVTAILEDADHLEVLHGRDAGFTIDRVVTPAPAHAAALFVDGDAPRTELPEPGIWSLSSGLMPGDGALLWLGERAQVPVGRAPETAGARVRTQPAAVASGDAAAEGGPAARSAELGGEAQDGQRNGIADPSELGITGQAEHGDDPADPSTSAVLPRRNQPVVRGYLCARRHLNDPRAHLCSQCGARLDQPPRTLGEGIRPPLGLLLLDNGTFYILDSDLVIGREPERSDQVRRGAQPVRIPDASTGMSRVHAEIRLVDWDVVVIDRGSANGTHIQQPGRQDWFRAVPGHPTPIQHGARVTLGGRVFTYDSQRRQR